MISRRWISAVPLVLGAALTAGLVAVQGTEPVGRTLSALGLPRAALLFLDAPAARGAALFHAGERAAAAQAFADAGDPYNQGVAAAWAGDYATALAAWDKVLATAPNDRETLANHALVTSLLAGTEFDPVAEPKPHRKETGIETQAPEGQGKGRASSDGDEANNAQAGFWMPEVTSEGLRRVPKIFDAQFVAANDRWLATLEDQPGRYLRARLAAEQKARVKAGTALPEPEDRE